jgi:FtsP/CotA-like multicopper oxidase with cupredoxin domain
VPDNVGTWLFHCHVSGHLKAGMQALYVVAPRKPQATE